MSRFASVTTAEVKTRGNYMPWLDATAHITVARCKYISPALGDPAFIVEFKIDAITVPPLELRDPEGRSYPNVGEYRDWYCSLKATKKGCPGASDMKAFCAVATPDCAELMERIDAYDGPAAGRKELLDELEEVYELIVNEAENPLQGTKLELATVAHKSAATGKVFTRHTWRAI